MMRVTITLGTCAVEVELDSGYSSDPLDDMCRRVLNLARAMLEVENATSGVEDPDVPTT